MTKEEFIKFVLSEAKLFISGDENEAVQKQPEKEIMPEQISKLVSEMKKINKKVDLRNPLIDPDGHLFEDIDSSIKVEKKQENLMESQKKRWGDLYNYQIPKDENR